jgi:hypothetical protein
MITLRHFQTDDLRFMDTAAPDDCRASLTLGPSWTAVNGDAVPVACGGVRVFWGRMGELWIVTNPFLAEVCKIALLRAMRTLVESVARDMRLGRLQMISEAARKDSERCARWLGLEPEAVLRAYGPSGKDCFIFSKIISGEAASAPQERNAGTLNS